MSTGSAPAQHRLSTEEIDRARSRFDLIAADVALQRKGRELAGLCPFHTEKSPSFYVVPDKALIHCFGCGWHGDAISYVMHARHLDFVDAVHEINGTAPRQARDAAPEARQHREASETDRQRVDSILQECTPVTADTAAYIYLWTRGLVSKYEAPSREALASLRAHPGLTYTEDADGPGPDAPGWHRWAGHDGCWYRSATFPALVAPITASDGSISGLQRIWCKSSIEYSGGRGPKDSRAAVSTRKKTLGVIGDGAVRLMPVRHVLGLAEGVETAIGAAILHRGVPVWATCGAARLGNVAIPESVDSVWIFGDNGEAGERLAEKAAAAYERARYAVRVLFPNPRFDDFNSQLLAEPVR